MRILKENCLLFFPGRLNDVQIRTDKFQEVFWAKIKFHRV